MSAPIFSREKCPAYFDFRFLGIITIKPCRPDNLVGGVIDHDKRAAGFKRFSEEHPEYVCLVTIALRMLFPNQRIRCDSKKIVPIFRPERPQFENRSCEKRLKLKRRWIRGLVWHTLAIC